MYCFPTCRFDFEAPLKYFVLENLTHFMEISVLIYLTFPRLASQIISAMQSFFLITLDQEKPRPVTDIADHFSGGWTLKMNYRVPPFHETVPREETDTRLECTRKALRRLHLDAGLFVWPTDLYYLTGTMQNGHLLVPVEAEPLFLVRRDLERARAESPLENIEGLTSLKQLPVRVADWMGRDPEKIGFELDVMPVSAFHRYRELWPDVFFYDIGPLIMQVRSIKTPYEIACIEKAGQMARQVYGRFPEFLQEGWSEIEAAGKMTALAYKLGHQNYLRSRSYLQEMFSWHLISGESGGIASAIDAPFGGYGLSPAFPVGAGAGILRRHEPILIDFGLCRNGYQVDLTRMFSIGEPPDWAKSAYEALTKIEKVLLDKMIPGEKAAALYELGLRTADRLGFGRAFLGPPGKKARFVGHGVGLEIDEPPMLAPRFDTRLAPGMTIALELKMVFPGQGAVGLENTVVITEGKPKKLTVADEAWGIV
jgi:Xaa-Pro dipeptidase